MAYEEVTLTEEEKAAAQQTFFKWTKGIGEKFAGRFVKTQEQTGAFAKKGRLDYVFKFVQVNDETGEKATVEGTLSGGIDLTMKLDKAKLKVGEKVLVEHVEDKEIGKDNPMKIFKVLVDRSTAAPAKPKPAPAPVPVADPADDIDF